MWRRVHTAIRDDPVYKKLKREVSARTPPNFLARNKDGFAQKKASFLRWGPGSSCCELKSFSMKSFHKDKKLIGRPKPKLNNKQENQFNQQLVPLVRSKARVLPFLILHTEVLAGAVRQERELKQIPGKK